MSRGRFITIEGIEGVGKSTQMALVVEVLETHGKQVIQTREPGGTLLAEKIRKLLLEHNDEAVLPVTELLLMFAARAQNVANVIKPALEDGKWVVCDRFSDASRAYQGGGRGLPAEFIEDLAQQVHPGLEPDLTLLLDAPIGIGRQRTEERGESDRIETEKGDFFQKVRARYLDLAQRHPSRFTIIDASRSIAEVSAEVTDAVMKLLSKI